MNAETIFSEALSRPAGGERQAFVKQACGDDERRLRDVDERLLALIDHPHIARVVDDGMTQDGQPCFAMELVNSLPLTRFCEETRLTTDERLKLFVPICLASEHAHQQGVIHRDLKPTNILVTLVEGTPIPKIIDFGVAKATGGRFTDESMSTLFGAVVGIVEYMAPEQAGWSATDIDTRADVYSPGVILYELLTGHKPFDGQRLRRAAFDEVIRILREEEPSRPSPRLSTDEPHRSRLTTAIERLIQFYESRDMSTEADAWRPLKPAGMVPSACQCPRPGRSD